MRIASIRTFVLACLASIGLGTSANSETILSFSQRSDTDALTATHVGATTTLSTGPNGASPDVIPITITSIGNFSSTNIDAFEIFNLALPPSTALTSTAAATATSQGGFSGTLLINSSSTGAGLNYLTANVTEGTLITSGTPGGVGFFQAENVPFTTDFPQLVGTPSGLTNVSLGLNNVSSGNILAGFTAQNVGLFTSAAIPEPASVVMSGMSVIAGLGYFGWRRLKATKA